MTKTKLPLVGWLKFFELNWIEPILNNPFFVTEKKKKKKKKEKRLVS